MSAVLHETAAERAARLLAWTKERAARAQAQVSISAPVPSVIKRISSPVISPVAISDIADDAKSLPTRDAQIAALQSMGLLGLKTKADDILLIVATACRAGAADLTGREIQAMYERRYGRRIESGTISARVSELLAAQRLYRRSEARVCTVTKEVATPVYVVAKQERLVY